MDSSHALRENSTGGLRGLASAGSLGGGLALAVEAARLAIPSRTSDMTTVLVALIGSTAGAAAVAARSGREPRRWARPAIALWLIALMLAAWTPPLPAPLDDWWPRWPQLVPFWAYYRRTDLAELADLAHEVMTCIPLGVLLATIQEGWSVRRAAAVGLGIALILEAGQLALADRTADVTDALSAAAGTVIGVILFRRCNSGREPIGPA